MLKNLSNASLDTAAGYIVQGEKLAGPAAVAVADYERYAAQAKAFKKVGSVATIGIDATVALVDDLHNGAGGVETVNDVAATVAADVLVQNGWWARLIPTPADRSPRWCIMGSRRRLPRWM